MRGSVLSRHLIAGRLSGASGVVTFCTCGLGFFAGYDGKETDESRAAALEVADDLFDQHQEVVGA
jgi:hypothetical protein